MDTLTTEKLKELYSEVGLTAKQIAEKYNLSRNAVKKRLSRRKIKKNIESKLSNKEREELRKLEKLRKKGYSISDLSRLAKALESGKPEKKEYHLGKNRITFGIIGDTHIGNIHYDPDLMDFAREMFNKEKVDFIIHGGDIMDGWYQNRPQSLFEQNAIGADRQLEMAQKELSKLEQPLYFITANHEHNTFMRGAGIEVGKVLEERLSSEGKEVYFLGNGEGNIYLKNKTSIKIMHPDGGTAYALSYRPQKIAESFTGGEKPNILTIHHFHKIEYLFYRNIHIFQGGTFEGQTKYMKGKSIPAHKGFWIVNAISSSKGQVDSLTSKLFPAYK